MTTLATVNVYLCANVLLVLAALLLWACKSLAARLRLPIAHRHLLAIGYALSIAALVLPTAGLDAASDVMPPTMQVWSATGMGDAAMANADPRIAMPLVSGNNSIPLGWAVHLAIALFAVGLPLLTVRIALDAIATVSVVRSAHTLRRLGKAKLLVSDRVRVPFSVWIPGMCFVVLPSVLLLKPRELQTAIRHEVQHHRQHDTKWLYLYALLKALFFWNPAAHWLAKRIQEWQEFACDTAVTARRARSIGSYCQSLVWVAEQAAKAEPRLLGASMGGSSGDAMLRRRIEALLMQPARHLRMSVVLAMGFCTVIIMAVAASTFANTVQDRRISMVGAQRIASATSGGISLPVNVSVVAQLNRLLSTPDGRQYVRASLGRMREHHAMISTKLAAAGLPQELLAVPMVESGYRNLPQGQEQRTGAGLWMFIKPTARNFGLVVDEQQDQRLDPVAETDAALRMLTILHGHYGDWGLALLAYNAGSWRVDKGIRETGSRDVWELVEKGFENDPNYVARVMAAALIIRNPSLAD